jgi:hypothetical protein
MGPLGVRPKKYTMPIDAQTETRPHGQASQVPSNAGGSGSTGGLMHTPMRIAAVALAAAISGWVLRGLQHEPPRTSPAATTHVSTSTTTEAPPAPMFSIPAGAPHLSSSKRNLFDYVARQRPPEPPAARQAAPVTAAVRIETPVPPPPEPTPKPRFSYRYIGRFGPEHRPIAAFSRDGEIVTAKAGESIGAGFRLRSIGMESVEVEGLDADVRQRVPLGGSSDSR